MEAIIAKIILIQIELTRLFLSKTLKRKRDNTRKMRPHKIAVSRRKSLSPIASIIFSYLLAK
jgi:hypothetical protein